jgi:NADH dehydrogenase [ubiquinone] 1 alpha subcomplex assembly factor 5
MIFILIFSYYQYLYFLNININLGGLSPHASPFALASDVAALMQGSGFSLPTVDVDTITVGFPNAIVLMEHLSMMGEGTASLNRQVFIVVIIKI